VIALRFGVALALAAGLAPAQALGDLEKRVTEFTLPNGLHFIVAERHSAPVVSFRTYVNAGAVDAPAGETGLARLLERLTSKGTESIGTRDWTGEKKALDALEEANNRLEAERNKGIHADEVKITSLQMQLRMAMNQADSFVRPNEYPGAIAEAGASGSGTTVNADSIQLFYSLPSNRIELWFLLESQRLTRPVFREFYKEREAQLGEVTASVNTNPQAKLLSIFPATAFEAHPYRNPLNGWPGDVEHLRLTDAKAFFEKYFVPGNITCAMAGDVNPADARRLAERYFGPMPARPMPPLVHTVEPAQTGPRTAVAGIANQAFVGIGYKRPDVYDRDDPVFDLLEIILGGDRQSVLYKDLIEGRALVSAAQVMGNYPGGRFPSLFTFLLRPTAGHTPEEVRAALANALLRLQTGTVDAATLARAKAKVRDNILARLSDNTGLAQVLATYAATYGDWRRLSADLDRLARATAGDIQRVAIKYFVPERLTMVSIVQPAAASAAPAKERE
jgi:predicted Zn-dependent peptidase